jgi:hypothetical protein
MPSRPMKPLENQGETRFSNGGGLRLGDRRSSPGGLGSFRQAEPDFDRKRKRRSTYCESATICVGPSPLEPADLVPDSRHYSAGLGPGDSKIVHEKSSENRINSLDELEFMETYCRQLEGFRKMTRGGAYFRSRLRIHRHYSSRP